MWGGSFGSSRSSAVVAPGCRIPATIFRLLSSSATYVVPFSMTGLLLPVALFRLGTIHDHAIGQAGPSILSSGIILQLGPNVLTLTARDAVGNTAAASMTVSFFTFTDDPLVAQSAPIKAVHMTELRAAIDSVRVARGLASFAWTDPTLTPGSTPAKGVHLLELRTALNQAYQAAGRPL